VAVSIQKLVALAVLVGHDIGVNRGIVLATAEAVLKANK